MALHAQEQKEGKLRLISLNSGLSQNFWHDMSDVGGEEGFNTAHAAGAL